LRPNLRVARRATVPPRRADEAAGQVKIINDAKATEVFGTKDRD
jgi:hypothetical protein